MKNYEFKKYKDPDNKFSITEVTMEVDTECLTDLLESFEDFLRGCGFRINGHLDVVDDDE